MSVHLLCTGSKRGALVMPTYFLSPNLTQGLLYSLVLVQRGEPGTSYYGIWQRSEAISMSYKVSRSYNAVFRADFHA